MLANSTRPSYCEHRTGLPSWNLERAKRGWSTELSCALWNISAHMGRKTHTCPSGAYVEPVMVNSFREQLFPFAWSTMNIYNNKKREFKKKSLPAGGRTTHHRWSLMSENTSWKDPNSTWPEYTSPTDVNTLHDTHLRVNLSSEELSNPAQNISNLTLRIFLSTKDNQIPEYVKEEKGIKELRASGMVKWNSVAALVLKPSGQQSRNRQKSVWERETGTNL